MTTPADRFKGWIDGLSAEWKERLRGWMVSWLSLGLEAILDILGRAMAPLLRPTIDKIESTGAIPPELKPILDEIKQPTGEVAALAGIGFLNRVVGSIKGNVFEYLTRAITRAFSYSANFYLPDPQLLLDYYLRGFLPSKDALYSLMRDHGIPPEETDKLLLGKKTIFPSDIVGEAWLRDKAKYAQYWDDVYKVMGLDKTLRQDQMRVELLQELAYKLPSPAEAIRWMAREVFEPDMASKYGLDDESDKIDYSFMETIGIKEDVARKHWRAHWEHASWSQVVQMLHRGAMTEADVYDWFRLVEIPPYWRRGLTQTMWELPGRVEARMLAQYGLVDKAFLVDLLEKDGLAREYRDVVADMMLVRGIRTDIQTRYAKGWLNAAEVKAEITAAGLSPQIASRLYQWIVKNAGPERTKAEKDLTEATIIKGVRKGLIGWDDGLQRLISLGYNEDEATLKLAIEIEVVEEEPTSTLTVQVDTIRRRRRQRIITRQSEIDQLRYIGIDPELALAYADNDDLRLVKATE